MNKCSKIKFDDALEKIGECGYFQRVRLIWLCLACFSCSTQVFLSNYITHVPSHRCRIPWTFGDTYAVQNDSHRTAIMKYIFLNSEGKAVDSCHMKKNGTNVKCDNGWVFDKNDFKETFVSEHQLVCDNGIWSSLVLPISFVFGMMLSHIPTSYISDRWGRTMTLKLCCAGKAFISFATASAIDPRMFLVIRIFAGMAEGGTIIAFSVYLMEIVTPRMRQHVIFPIQYGFAVGILLVCFLGYLFRTWRALSAATDCFVVLYCAVFFVFPESPRWLLIKGRKEEANIVLKQIAKDNGHPVSDAFIQKIEQDTNLEMAAQETMFKFITYPTMTLLLFNICFQWFIQSTVYMALTLNAGMLYGQFYINQFFSGAVEIPFYILAHLLVDRVGRRIPYAMATMCSAVCCIALALSSFEESKDTKVGVTISAILAKGFSTMAYSIIVLWTGEMFPTLYRNICFGFAAFFATLGSMLSPLYFELGEKYGINAACLLSIIFVLVILSGLKGFTLKETVTLPLPFTLDDAVQQAENKIDGKSDLDPRKMISKEQESNLYIKTVNLRN